ncbi:MAG TPA: prolipoprotein diacylglyceryl transferase [Flavobacteriales bacterium]|nr:diacylglyceryl transferase [Flavobacteriales bacterium]HRE75393.1 prolipoprotein diacylglyceryl transferase [Flavobacteriales bacterium]HRE96087.1 prolipoprotein diacylglyceryl transferase [Flavobacteriales bacterium]HRJ36621.1 prolipoprotein diacylglyceryl transferase [Flavobacteriales bacterium]HRJ37445.1 prolipoprotein diacylglyceryl transferase [Flavobacteriales bacterium]
MYPTLYHFFYDLTGFEIPFFRAVNSFGFFVAISFVVASWVYSRELKRLEESGFIPVGKIVRTYGLPVPLWDVAGNALLGFFLGFKIVHGFFYPEIFSNFPAFLFSLEGNIFGGILGGLAMGAWRYYEGKKLERPTPEVREEAFHAYEHLGKLVLLAVVWGFIGAKLFAWLEDPQPLGEFLSDPFRGLTMYGGLICATIAMTLYMRKHKLPVWRFYDAGAPAVMLAYGVGRIGCHVSGDGDWGIVNTAPKPGWMSFLPDWLWSYNYPNNVMKMGTPMSDCIYNDDYCYVLPQTVFPTPFYETLMCLLFFGVLWLLRKRILVPGVLFMVYLMLNGVERFLIEGIRVNDKYMAGGLAFTQAQLISFVFIIAGAAGIFFLRKRYRQAT